ncbi:MAG TPA: hypothetical protein VFE33_04100 [Thermoanaerobaculia bacterium]|nr:hypothetical protein [Thermoanaerobaculia bacterium]
MHIAFLTLFLGLVSGRVPVDLAVTGPAAASPGNPASPGIVAVELSLDGVPAGRIAGPPFKGKIDFGKDLLPHHLVAQGVDAQGEEVARTEQWVNLPRSPAEIETVPQSAPDGRVVAVRLQVQSLTRETPARVAAAFDGAAVAIESNLVSLPPYSADSGHLLSIEAAFPSGLTARRDLAFGFGGEVSTDLTAVPVRLRGRWHGRPEPAPPALQGWFSTGGKALRPVAVEDGPGELLVVRAPRVPAIFEAIGRMRARQGSEVSYDRGLFSSDAKSQGRQDYLRKEMKLDPRDRTRFIHPDARRYAGAGDVASELFPSSQDFTADDGGLYWLLARVVQEVGPEVRLADAVAVAGLQALHANHRRAVLLVLDGATSDASRYDPATVRRYLAAIHVPLYVWSVAAPHHDPRIAAWGEVQNISSFSDLRRAFDRLDADLASQRIVWLDGRHLPQGIALSKAAEKAFELAAGAGW